MGILHAEFEPTFVDVGDCRRTIQTCPSWCRHSFPLLLRYGVNPRFEVQHFRERLVHGSISSARMIGGYVLLYRIARVGAGSVYAASESHPRFSPP